MTQDLQSFLIAVGLILLLTLFIPAIESIANILRRRRNPPASNPLAEQDVQSSFSRKAA